MNKVGIIGAGMMGAEIALCFAMADYEVIIKDQTLELAKKVKTESKGYFTRKFKRKNSNLIKITARSLELH